MIRLLAGAALAAVFTTCAWADVAVVGHPASSVRSLSIAEAQRYYLKRKLVTPQREPVEIGALPAQSATTLAFNRDVLKMNENRLMAYWAQKVFSGNATPPQQFPSPEALKLWVSQTPNALGYIDVMDVDDRVKVLLTVAQEP